MKTKIIIADDNGIYRDGLSSILSLHKGINLMDQAANGKDLIRLVRKQQPDIIITEIKMSVMDGIKATTLIHAEYPEIGIVALSMQNEELLLAEMLQAGARGYLLKSSSKSEIIKAIKIVQNGGNYYCKATSKLLIDVITKRGCMLGAFKQVNLQLSDKEIALIQMICKDYTNLEIGNEIKKSKRTVEGYRHMLMQKIQAKGIAGIVKYAIENGIYHFE